MRTTVLTLVKALSASVTFPDPIYEFGARPVEGQQHRGQVRDYFPLFAAHSARLDLPVAGSRAHHNVQEGVSPMAVEPDRFEAVWL